MNKFLKKYKIRLNHDETENLIKLIISNDIESVIKKKRKPNNKSLEQDCCFTAEFYQTFEKRVSVLLKSPKNIRGNSFKFNFIRTVLP